MKRKIHHPMLALAMLLVHASSGAQSAKTINQNIKNQEITMSTIQKNKEVVRKVYEEALNKRNMDLLDDLISDQYVGPTGETGPNAFKEPVSSVINAVSDAQWKIQELIGEDNKVMVKWMFYGTHTGQFLQFPATGNKVANEGTGIYELEHGKIVKTHVQTDRLGFLQQLKVLPTDLTQLPKKAATPDQVQFIDKFIVPQNGKQEFLERVKINRNLIKTLPGFIEDAAYESTDQQGNLIYITVAVWENDEAIKNAKEIVQAEYKKQGFNMQEMFARLHITMDRGLYKKLD